MPGKLLPGDSNTHDLDGVSAGLVTNRGVAVDALFATPPKIYHQPPLRDTPKIVTIEYTHHHFS